MQIETQRLLLREFKRDDWKDAHEYAKDPDVVRFMEWGPSTVEETKDFLDLTLSQQREKPRQIFNFAVTLKESGKLIGACSFRLVPMDPEQADIGYCYNKNYWGQGYGTEACRAVMKLAFEQWKLHRMYATCDAGNVGSETIMRKCGMRKEGHFVQDKKVKGNWRDTLLYAIVRAEWEKLPHE